MIKISADSTCDLSPEILDKLDISIIPLNIIVDEKSFRDGEEITPTDIFRYVDVEGKRCKTAAINIYEYQQQFEELSLKYESVIHICLSSNLSSCYQNAIIAAQNFDNVYVVDSRNLSSGSGYIVYEAALMAKNSLSPKEICHVLDTIIPSIESSFIIDRLDYLSNGGRCSTLTARGAKLMNIKPCIGVIEGKMKVTKKYRGSFQRCINHYIKDRLYNRMDIDLNRIFIAHPTGSPEIIAKAKETILQYAEFKEIIEIKAGSTISNHCGPNTLGIFLKRK